MTWDMDTDNTTAMLDDMGVCVLEDAEEIDQASEMLPKPTPYIPTQTNLFPPGVSTLSRLYITCSLHPDPLLMLFKCKITGKVCNMFN